MHKRKLKKIVIISASILIAVGLITSGIVVGSFYFHKKSVESLVDKIDNQTSVSEGTTQGNKGSAGQSPDDNSDNGENEGSHYSEGIYYSNGEKKPNNVDVKGLREASLKYNEMLKSSQSSYLVGEESYTYAALDLTKYGIYDNIYGYVSAPAIDMELPIYLGVTDGTMAYGAAHFCYTSLPTGGESTNVALAGHTGYIGRWLFDSIKYLEEGDDVNVKTYIGNLNYKVVDKKIKLPNESEDLFIERGKDKLTLVTCIYDSDGTYMRCIVICERR